MAQEFYNTRTLFRNSIVDVNTSEFISYDIWKAAPADEHACLLYLNFFDEIVMAWYKAKSFYASEEEGVETIMQYLMKNVPIILDNPKKYTKQYIYKVAYNCLYCISHDRLIDKRRWELETSNIVAVESGDELDLFDLYDSGDRADGYDDEKDEMTKLFWEVIENIGLDAVEVAKKLICGDTTIPKGMGRNRRKEIMKAFEEQLDFFKPDFYND